MSVIVIMIPHGRFSLAPPRSGSLPFSLLYAVCRHIARQEPDNNEREWKCWGGGRGGGASGGGGGSGRGEGGGATFRDLLRPSNINSGKVPFVSPRFRPAEEAWRQETDASLKRCARRSALEHPLEHSPAAHSATFKPTTPSVQSPSKVVDDSVELEEYRCLYETAADYAMSSAMSGAGLNGKTDHDYTVEHELSGLADIKPTALSPRRGSAEYCDAARSYGLMSNKTLVPNKLDPKHCRV